jgi:hypothetical protein
LTYSRRDVERLASLRENRQCDCRRFIAASEQVDVEGASSTPRHTRPVLSAAMRLEPEPKKRINDDIAAIREVQ